MILAICLFIKINIIFSYTMDNFITHQNWRYATKKFDANKKINTKDLTFLKEAIRLSVSSYGLQPYKIFIIENTEIRNQIKEVAFNQNQITDASHLLVFANYTHLTPDHIDEYITNMAQIRNVDVANISGYGNFMKNIFATKNPNQINDWAAKQTYIALANLVHAAAELKIDVTPMEGFIPERVNEILNLNALNLNAVLIAPIGYRANDDEMQHLAKVRKTDQELFIEL